MRRRLPLRLLLACLLALLVRSSGVLAQDTTADDDAGFANRGTFVVDRTGIVRFAEMKQPGEPRDQAVWTGALAALRSD